MDHTRPLETKKSHRCASEVFPTLSAPDDAGRVYPLWPPAAEMSALASLISILKTYLRLKRKGTIPNRQTGRRPEPESYPERGSGSW